jgi:hypothetical protein
MSRERELLQRALAVLGQVHLTDHFDFDLEDDIRAELQKPEPVDFQAIEIEGGRLVFTFTRRNLPDGKYRLLAERIEDD